MLSKEFRETGRQTLIWSHPCHIGMIGLVTVRVMLVISFCEACSKLLLLSIFFLLSVRLSSSVDFGRCNTYTISHVTEVQYRESATFHSGTSRHFHNQTPT